MPELLNRKDAIKYLNLPEKYFDNYFKSSQEIVGQKIKGRWYFNKSKLDDWNNLKNERTVNLSLVEYQTCFEFAIKMAYSSKASHGSGIRGVRSEVQMSDDFILGILAEHGVQKFLRNKFGINVDLDMEVHPDHITPQDFISIEENSLKRELNIGVAIKSSKFKSCFNIIPANEYEDKNRMSDVYIFVRVGLPSDHLFRILRKHSFFKEVSEFLEKDEKFRTIDELDKIPIWICGFSYRKELEKVKSIPGQEFSNGYRYVKSVSKMKNSDLEWKDLIEKF